MKLKESNIVESMENKELGTLRLDVDLYPKLKQKQPRLDNVIEEKYIDCKWTENVSEIKKMSIIQDKLHQWIRNVKKY